MYSTHSPALARVFALALAPASGAWVLLVPVPVLVPVLVLVPAWGGFQLDSRVMLFQ